MRIHSSSAEVPETRKEFTEYVNQTENLRNVTVVTNLGTGKEQSKRIQSPKSLLAGFECDDDLDMQPSFTPMSLAQKATIPMLTPIPTEPSM